MDPIRATFRILFILISILILGPLAILATVLPEPKEGHPLTWRIIQLATRLILWGVNLELSCPDAERFKRHQGFVFPNHITFMDIAVLYTVSPVRFLAKKEVKRWPVIGSVGKSIRTVFVDRSNKTSRAEARKQLANIERSPAVVLFPEGKKGPGHELKPFRFGAFEIVTQGEVPFLPCAIAYEYPEWTIWYRGEFVLTALWRMCAKHVRGKVTLHVLAPIHPTREDDPEELSVKVHDQITAVLRTNNAFTSGPPKRYKESV